MLLRSGVSMLTSSKGRATATTARRRAEETERTAARDLEAVAREAAWHIAQVERLAGELARHREALAAHEIEDARSAAAR